MFRFIVLFLLSAFPAFAVSELGDQYGNRVFTDVTTASTVVTAGNSLTTTLRGQSTATVNISAITGTTATFEVSNDGTNYSGVLCTTPSTGLTALTSTTTGFFVCPIAGSTNFRVRAVGGTSFTGSLNISQGTSTATTAASNIAQIIGSTAVASATGVLKVGIVGGAAGAAIDAANNAAAPANVLVLGVETTAQGSQPTASTGGNVRRAQANLEGSLYFNQGGPNRFSCVIEAATATTACLAAPGAGLRAYVTGYVLSNEAATVQSLDIIFGTTGACTVGATALTHKHQFGTVATTTSPFVVSVSLPTPLVPTAANAICVRPSAATAFGATIVGYIAP